MKINIQTPGFTAQNKLLDMVRKHVERLDTLSGRILEAEVCLSIANSSTQENKICEIRLVIPGNDLFSSRQRQTFDQSVREACKALHHQLVKWKDIHNSAHLRGAKQELKD